MQTIWPLRPKNTPLSRVANNAASHSGVPVRGVTSLAGARVLSIFHALKPGSTPAPLSIGTYAEANDTPYFCY